jgi:hypothetical protein
MPSLRSCLHTARPLVVLAALALVTASCDGGDNGSHGAIMAGGTYGVNLSLSIVGTGMVQSQDADEGGTPLVSCTGPGDCAALTVISSNAHDVLQLRATPALGWRFDSWAFAPAQPATYVQNYANSSMGGHCTFTYNTNDAPDGLSLFDSELDLPEGQLTGSQVPAPSCMPQLQFSSYSVPIAYKITATFVPDMDAGDEGDPTDGAVE